MDSIVGEGISYEAWFNLVLVLKPIDVSNGSLPRFIRGQSREVLQLWRRDLIGWFDAFARTFRFGSFQMAAIRTGGYPAGG